jgi:ubiquinol-cytochrome c reductase iron-sulfur subunit
MISADSLLVFHLSEPISKDLLIIKESFSLGMAQTPPAGGKVSRRDFLKLMAAAGTVMTFAPFVDWGKFLPNPSSNVGEKVKVELEDGTVANVKTFEVNTSQVVIYPRSEDEVLNTEAFRTWQLIRLPKELGGDKNDASAFRIYSMVCLHLWCLWKYWPQEGRKRGECPCHGSMYDPLTGKAFAGPASLQGPPSNVLPRLDLEVESNGDLSILPPRWDPNANGIVGYGRYINV